MPIRDCRCDGSSLSPRNDESETPGLAELCNPGLSRLLFDGLRGRGLLPKGNSEQVVVICDSAWQNRRKPLNRRQGVPARCVGAPLRASQKRWQLGPHSFWTSSGTDLKGARADRIFLSGAKAFRRFPEVRPVQDCRCRAALRSRLNPQSLHRRGKTVLGPKAPRPVRTSRTRCDLRRALGGRI